MTDRRLKNLDAFSDESEQFEERLLQLKEIKDSDSAGRQLNADIAAWLEECASHGRFIPPASADRRALRSIIERWKSRLRAHGALVEDTVSLADFDPRAGVVLKTECPYPGLEPYGENRCDSFFGRGSLVSECVQYLEKKGNRILLLIGASGSGKSSVAMAGILPQLKENHRETWLFCPPLTPGANPLAALAASVAKAINHAEQAEIIEKSLTAEPETALEQLAILSGDRSPILLIDQFEELFTQCHDERAQSFFAQVLCALSDPAIFDRTFSCRILLTLRTDQLARFEKSRTLKSLYDRLIDEKNEHFYYLSTIGFDDIKQAIKKPAEEAGLRFIPISLIDKLASQTAGLTNGLPLLQFSLQHLWKNRPRNETGEPLDLVTEEMVTNLPDVERALGRVADNIFQGFTAEQKKICERLLLELMVLDEGFEEPMRRRRSEDELKNVLASLPGSPDDPAMVIDVFVEERLLRRFGEGPESQIEVAHEALLRHWGHIYNLLMEGEVKERLHLIKKIKAEALDWKSHPDNPGDYLNLKGERLKSARRYAAEKWLEEEESAAYVDACIVQEDLEHEAKQKAIEGKEKAERLKWWYYSSLVVIVLIFTTLFMIKLYRDADKANHIADLLGKGNYYFQLGSAEFDQFAKASFREADKLAEGKSKPARLGLGLSLFREKGKGTEAQEQFDYLISNNGDKEEGYAVSTYYSFRGQLFQRAGKHDEAIKDFSTAIALLEENNPKDKRIVDLHYYSGLSYLAQKEKNSALKSFSTANKLLEASKPESEVLAKDYLNLGRSYLALEDLDKAEELFNKTISVHRQMVVPALDELGTLYLKRGQVNKDQNQCEKAEEQFEKAEEQFDQAISFARKEKSTMENLKIKLGNALAGQNKLEEAIGAYTDARRISPNSALLELYIADAYNRNNDRENAQIHWEKAENLAESDDQLKVEGASEFFTQKLKYLKDNTEENCQKKQPGKVAK